MVASRRALVVVIAALVPVLAPATARAQRAPWAEGVTDSQKAEAKALLDAGNALLLDKKYVEALDKYTAAVAVWDHPAIRFNMVRCLIQLGRNLEAFDNLEKSLQYGAAPLEDTVYNEALSYQKLLASQIGDVRVRCEQPGVTLTLDGQPLAVCPATETRRVLVGAHQIVGTKAGLLPTTVELVVEAGATRDVEIKLDPLAKGARIVHRWPQYVPYSVFGGGVAVGGIGLLVYAIGRSQMSTFDQHVDASCTTRCATDEIPGHIADAKRRGEVMGTVGASLMITGGAAVVTGAVMIYLNRGRTVYPEISPTPGGAAVSWTTRF
jgi:hypothetical protein